MAYSTSDIVHGNLYLELNSILYKHLLKLNAQLLLFSILYIHFQFLKNIYLYILSYYSYNR